MMSVKQEDELLSPLAAVAMQALWLRTLLGGGSIEAQGGAGAPPLAGKRIGNAGICPFACALQVFD
ncbi:unnamed protein product [Prunus armeniaca]